MWPTDEQVMECLDGLLSDEFLALSRKARCNMAVATETRVSMAEAEEWVRDHPKIDWPLSKQGRIEAAVKQIVKERFPEWKDDHDIRCSFRGMDQEYHVVNRTLRDRDISVENKIGSPSDSKVIKDVEALKRTDFGRSAPDPLRQMEPDVSVPRVRHWILGNISGMASNAMSGGPITAAEFVMILTEIRDYVDSKLTGES